MSSWQSAVANRNGDGETPLIEWLMGGLGAVVFCAMIAILVFAGLSGADGPPDVRARVQSITTTSDGYVVEFIAENAGASAAADVEIIAELADGESASARFDYLAPHSSRRGGVFFRSDPRVGRLTLRAEGYADP